MCSSRPGFRSICHHISRYNLSHPKALCVTRDSSHCSSFRCTQPHLWPRTLHDQAPCQLRVRLLRPITHLFHPATQPSLATSFGLEPTNCGLDCPQAQTGACRIPRLMIPASGRNCSSGAKVTTRVATRNQTSRFPASVSTPPPRHFKPTTMQTAAGPRTTSSSSPGLTSPPPVAGESRPATPTNN